MNRVLSCYTEIDSIFDLRRTMTQKFLVGQLGMIREDTDSMSDAEYTAYTQAIRYKGDELWEKHIEANYRARRMDRFEYPDFGFNREEFKKLYNQRSHKDWIFGAYKSKFTHQFLKAIIDLELLVESPIMFNAVVLYVNIFPYDYDEEMRLDLVNHLQHHFGGKVRVATINSRTPTHTVDFYRQFDYVLKYDLFLSEDSGPMMDSVGTIPIPGTSFIVPDLLVKESDEFIGEVSDRIFSATVQLAPVFKVVPRHHSFYDYI